MATTVVAFPRTAPPPPAPPSLSTARAVSSPPIAPGIVSTIYGDLPRDIDRPEARDLIRSSDAICLHTAADPGDVRNAALVRAIGCRRVWLAIPANYLVGFAQRKGIDAAVVEARRVGQVALDMGAEVLELNGEGQSDGQKPGDWIPADPAEAVRLARLAAAILEALRDLLGDRCAISWTSHDMPGFKLPWGEILARVDFHAPQHYPAMKGAIASQRILEARVAKSEGRWDALADRGEIPTDVIPHGSRWTPYGQAWGTSTGAMAWLLCQAPIGRLWAFPGSWEPNALDALRVAQKIRTEAGFGVDAVERWQGIHGLTVDGVLGRQSLAAALTR